MKKREYEARCGHDAAVSGANLLLADQTRQYLSQHFERRHIVMHITNILDANLSFWPCICIYELLQ